MFLGRFIPGLVLVVEWLRGVSFEVHLDIVHPVLALFVPGSLLCEHGRQLLLEGAVFGPVLNEVRHHVLLVEDQNREVENALRVFFDRYFHYLR